MTRRGDAYLPTLSLSLSLYFHGAGVVNNVNSAATTINDKTVALALEDSTGTDGRTERPIDTHFERRRRRFTKPVAVAGLAQVTPRGGLGRGQ